MFYRVSNGGSSIDIRCRVYFRPYEWYRSPRAGGQGTCYFTIQLRGNTATITNISGTESPQDGVYGENMDRIIAQITAIEIVSVTPV